MTQLQTKKIEELKGSFRGEILLPRDEACESARKIWNAMIDKRPAVIVRCLTTSDVVQAVNYTRDNGLLLAVRGGGHHFFNASAPFASGGVYVNCLTADEGDRVRAAYGSNYHRLAQVKSKYDPDNVFRMNQNIKPS